LAQNSTILYLWWPAGLLACLLAGWLAGWLAYFLASSIACLPSSWFARLHARWLLALAYVRGWLGCLLAVWLACLHAWLVVGWLGWLAGLLACLPDLLACLLACWLHCERMIGEKNPRGRGTKFPGKNSAPLKSIGSSIYSMDTMGIVDIVPIGDTAFTCT